jgi:hypothetical protein
MSQKNKTHKETRNPSGQLHSFDDKPAIVFPNGTKMWYKNGAYHRDNDNPAIVHSDGTKSWWKNGKNHRDNGEPSFIYFNGDMAWFFNGNALTEDQVELLKKIIASEIQHLPWLLNEDELLNSVIEKRLNEGS